VVSDAAAGGQVLMCGSSFRAVQHLTEELGCVTHEGMKYAKLYSIRSAWDRLFRSVW
jgi:hypothetical protein